MPALRRLIPLALAAGVIAVLAGCSSAGGGTPSANQSMVLTKTPMAKLFPTNAQWQAADDEAGFSAEPPKVQTVKKGQYSAATKVGNSTAVEVGAACAKVLNHYPSLASWKEGGNQEVATGGEDEFLIIVRTSSPQDAAEYFNYTKQEVAACDKNQGDAIYRKIGVGVDNTIGFTEADKAGDEVNFNGVGQIGQFLVIVSDENRDDVKVGPEMLKFAVNHIEDLAGENK
jgi:hypothetical protein